MTATVMLTPRILVVAPSTSRRVSLDAIPAELGGEAAAVVAVLKGQEAHKQQGHASEEECTPQVGPQARWSGC